MKTIFLVCLVVATLTVINVESMNCGCCKTGSGHKGSESDGSGHKGSGNKESGHKGSGNNGSGHKRSGKNGSGHKGSGNNGSGNKSGYASEALAGAAGENPSALTLTSSDKKGTASLAAAEASEGAVAAGSKSGPSLK